MKTLHLNTIYYAKENEHTLYCRGDPLIGPSSVSYTTDYYLFRLTSDIVGSPNAKMFSILIFKDNLHL